MKKIIIILSTLLFPKLVFTQTSGGSQWYKGNIHVHTRFSDGNTSLDSVVNWYKNNHYDFLAITDHNKLTYSDSIKQLYQVEKKFILIPGVEVTDRFNKQPVHLNGIGINQNVLPKGGNSVSDVIDNDLLSIQQAQGIGTLNHPNGLLTSAISSSDLIYSKRVTHFEVCCADYRGGSGKPSTDKIWDDVLSQGKRLFGLTSDDAHNFKPYSKDPGSAWIMVQAESLDQPLILDGIKEGRFYSTTGVIVKEYIVSNGLIKVILNSDDYGYITLFIGRGGTILLKDESNTPTYSLKKSDQYARCKIERSDGAIAWFQPVFWSESK